MQPENSKPQKCDMSHIPYWASDSVQYHSTKL